MAHLKCLRHMLVNIGKKRFSEQIGNLISVSSNQDFDELKNLYTDLWLEINDEKVLSNLEKNLNKIGLTFKKQNKIEILNQEKWNEISMVRRALYRMPSCTNHLESTHGHMNGLIPRRNSFWPSLHKICDNIMKKIQNFESYYKQNYSNYRRKIINKCKNKPVDIMRKSIINYKTDIILKHVNVANLF